MSNKLAQAIAELKDEATLAEVRALKEQGVPALEILQYLQDGMAVVGKRYEKNEYFLSELIMSADIFKQATGILGDSFDTSAAPNNGVFLIGTVYGDIHDIGKEIVSTVLSCNGFKVIDLGVDVPAAKYIEAIKEHKPDLVGMSCLLTTAYENMKETVKAIEAAGLRDQVKILIGGGPVTETTCKYVNADAFCKNAQEAVSVSKKLLGVS